MNSDCVCCSGQANGPSTDPAAGSPCQLAISNGTIKILDAKHPTVLVFVYGTLTEPVQVSAVLGDDSGEYEFVGTATLEGLHRVEGQYPTLVPGGCVEGKLLSVDDSALERLDRYEGVDQGLYARVEVPRPDGRPVWCYVGDPARLGVDIETPWPSDSSFRDSVRTSIVQNEIMVHPHE